MINNKQMYLSFLKEEKLTKEDVPYSKYAEIIKMHNIEVMNQILLKNKQYDMGYLLGHIQAVEVNRVIKVSKSGNSYTSIDWNESNKRKQELINKGQLPLEKIRNEKGEIIGDNGGVEWLIYNLSETKPTFHFSRFRRKGINDNDKPFYPLSLIKQFHIEFTPKNFKLLNRCKFIEGISYTKLGL